MIATGLGPLVASYALSRMQIHALVLAGGSGDRFAAEMPKQFVRLAGEPILLRSLRTVAGAGIDRLVVVSHPSWLAETREIVDGADLGVPTTVVAGGVTRNESTLRGLAALEADDEDIVLIEFMTNAPPSHRAGWPNKRG